MFNEEEGTKAIIALQGFANVEESKAKAKAGWNSMSDSEKETTEKAYNAVFGSKNK